MDSMEVTAKSMEHKQAFTITEFSIPHEEHDKLKQGESDQRNFEWLIPSDEELINTMEEERNSRHFSNSLLNLEWSQEWFKNISSFKNITPRGTKRKWAWIKSWGKWKLKTNIPQKNQSASHWTRSLKIFIHNEIRTTINHK